MLNFVGNPPFTAVSAQPGARRASCFFLCFGFGLGVVLLCSCSCCVSCVGVGFFSSCLCSFFLCPSFLFLVFFLFFFLFVVVFRLSGSVPVPPGFGRSVRFARKVPLRSRANVAGGRWSFPSGFGKAWLHTHPRRRPSNPMRVMTWNLWRNKKYQLRHYVAVDIFVRHIGTADGPHGPRVDISVPCCGPWVWKREPAHIGSAPSRMRYRFSSVRGPVPRDGPGRTCRWPMDRHRCFWMVAAARRVRDWRSASRPDVVG